MDEGREVMIRGKNRCKEIETQTIFGGGSILVIKLWAELIKLKLKIKIVICK